MVPSPAVRSKARAYPAASRRARIRRSTRATAGSASAIWSSGRTGNSWSPARIRTASGSSVTRLTLISCLQLHAELPAERTEQAFQGLRAGRLTTPLDPREALLRRARLQRQPYLRPTDLLPLVA